MGNFLLPMMIGAPDVAFPRLNLFSWYLYIAGAAFTVYALIAGGVDTGWTFYPPFSSHYSHSHVIPAAAGVFVVGFSSIATGVNFLATIHMLRAPGMTWFRLPLFAWSMYVTQHGDGAGDAGAGDVAAAALAERYFGLPIFDPAAGGDPLLFQHLFWFYSHPAVYIMILPAMGVVSEVIRLLRAAAGVRLRFHGVRADDDRRSRLHGLGPSHVRRRPIAARQSGVLVSVIHRRGAIRDQGVQLDGYALSRPYRLRGADDLRTRVSSDLFTIGGLTGLFLASVPIDIATTDTYFVVAHFHTIMVGGTVSAFMAGIHYWWPKSHRQTLQRVLGAVRRHHHVPWLQRHLLAAIRDGLARDAAALSLLSRRFSNLAHSLERRRGDLAAAYLMPLVYLGGHFFGAKAPDNPWHATGLEWQTPVAAAETKFPPSAADRRRPLRLSRLRPRGRSWRRGARPPARRQP